jgi:CRP-like cAMP-binding protein
MYEALFNYLQLFHDMSAAEMTEITRHARYRPIREGETLLEEGRTARELFFICEGILKIVKQNTKGNNVTQFFLKENHFCTILNSFRNEVAAEESIMAACDGAVIVINKDSLYKLYTTIPYLQPLIEGIQQQTLISKIQVRNSYQGEEASVRYQKFLTLQPDIALRVSLADIASYLGITPQSLSRIRRTLR